VQVHPPLAQVTPGDLDRVPAAGGRGRDQPGGDAMAPAAH
jgi:hypothetical protein